MTVTVAVTVTMAVVVFFYAADWEALRRLWMVTAPTIKATAATGMSTAAVTTCHRGISLSEEPPAEEAQVSRGRDGWGETTATQHSGRILRYCNQYL